MAHVRKQLRDAVLTMLTGLTSTGARVKGNRATPIGKDAGLSLTVRTPAEQSRDDTMGGGQERVITVRCVVSGKAASETLITDALDAAAVEVEEAFAADTTIGGLAMTYEYRGADLVLDGEGDKVAGTLALAFDVIVNTDRGDPETAL